MSKGTLYTISVTNSGDDRIAHVKHKYLIVRSAKNAESLYAKGWVQVPQLSPSSNLFYSYLDLKKKGLWNQDAFDTIYTPNFLNQMKTDNIMRDALNRVLALLRNGEDVVFACYCPEYNLCHRSILGSAYKQRNYNVIELE